ncbi:MAG: hypothetical protein Q8O56_10405 [Solirubrobacteraceae bacterium]|nr:hypothetical protein [Solirubrobacteraceae bacterium]
MSPLPPRRQAEMDANLTALLEGPDRETWVAHLRTIGTPHSLALIEATPPLAEVSALQHLHHKPLQAGPPAELSLLTPQERAELAARRGS